MGELKLAKPISIKECVLIAIQIEKEKGNVPNKLQDADMIAKVKDTHKNSIIIFNFFFIIRL